MRTIIPPELPTLPMMEDGSPFPALPPLAQQNTITIADGDAAGLWQAIDTAPGGTAIEFGGSMRRPQWWWPKMQRRANGWVVVRPRPAVASNIRAKIGERRLTEADAALLPTLHATHLLGESAFGFGMRKNTDANVGPSRASSFNVWFDHICFDLEFAGHHGNPGMLLNGDCLAFSNCLMRRSLESQGYVFKGNWVIVDGHDVFMSNGTITGCNTPPGTESQTMLTLSRCTHLHLENMHLDKATQSLFLYDTNDVNGGGKTTEHVTVRHCVLGDHYGKYAAQPVGNDGKALLEIKSARWFLMENCVVGPQRGTTNGGQIVRLTVARHAGSGNSGIDSDGLDWTIRNNYFHDSPGEFALLCSIKNMDVGEYPDGIHRVAITDNVFRNVSTSRRVPPLQIQVAQWQILYPKNNTSDIEIARNICYHDKGNPFGFVWLLAGGTPIAENRIPGPFSVHDNMIECGGEYALNAEEFTPNVGEGEPALKAAFHQAEWEYNAHGNTKLAPHSATNINAWNLRGIFVDEKNLDFEQVPGGPLLGKASHGGNMGLMEPREFKQGIVAAIAGAVGSIAPPVDKPPTVKIVSPADGAAIVSGPLEVWFEATDDVGLKSASLYVDEIFHSRIDVSGVKWTDKFLIAKLLIAGPRTLRVEVTDVKFQTAQADVTVTVQEPAPADVTPPTVKIWFPPDGSTQIQPFTVLSEATDDTELALIHLELDATLIASRTVAPGNKKWELHHLLDPATLKEGAHTLRVIAEDAAGNVSKTDAISVVIARTPTLDERVTNLESRINEAETNVNLLTLAYNRIAKNEQLITVDLRNIADTLDS